MKKMDEQMKGGSFCRKMEVVNRMAEILDLRNIKLVTELSLGKVNSRLRRRRRKGSVILRTGW